MNHNTSTTTPPPATDPSPEAWAAAIAHLGWERIADSLGKSETRIVRKLAVDLDAFHRDERERCTAIANAHTGQSNTEARRTAIIIESRIRSGGPA